ncbi:MULTISPECIES: hypothetical protein [unclassified Cobetia]|uniref:hypothetical protein n=1 Tax=unclassified Cobetia TaxID=2609414 RepID=UPI00159D6F67|nr:MULTISPECIES: hypothetical protein [unclassified Cobetia]MCO7233197.1 hypothetical protein [Cobetia sp. Dlab-2-AX]MCO7236471.1 hypothetical protein [Cobetia sp. Dlab-2-U]NVN56033.1 hypothetical protein [bacterium Scap17]
MSGINPLIDSLLHQVLGRAAQPPPPADSGVVFPTSALQSRQGLGAEDGKGSGGQNGANPLLQIGAGTGSGARPAAPSLDASAALLTATQASTSPTGALASASSSLPPSGAYVELTTQTQTMSHLLDALSQLVASGSPSARVGLALPEGQSLASLLARGQPLTGLLAPMALSSASLHSLSAALSQQIHQSGLFYEADLLAWVENRVGLADLAGHPQLANARLEALLAWRQWPVLAEAHFTPWEETREGAFVWRMRDMREELRREPRAGMARPSGDMLLSAGSVDVARHGASAHEASALGAYRANMQLGVAQPAASDVSRQVIGSDALASGLVQQQLLLILGQPFNWQGLLMPGLHVFFSLYFPGPPYRHRSRDEGERRAAPLAVIPVAAHDATPDSRRSDHGEAQQWKMSLTLVAGDSDGEEGSDRKSQVTSEQRNLAAKDNAEQGEDQTQASAPASAESEGGEKSRSSDASERATLALKLTWYQLAAPVALVVEIERLTQPSSNAGQRDAALRELQHALAQGLAGMAPRVHVRPVDAVSDHEAPASSDGTSVDAPRATAEQATDFMHTQGERLGQRIQQRANSLGLSVHEMPELVEMLATGLPARKELPTALMQVVVKIAELWAERYRSQKAPRE